MVTAFAILAIFLSRVLKWNCTHCNALKVFFLLIWWNPNHLFIKTASRPPILFEEDMLSAHTTVSLCWVTVPLSIASVFDEHCCTQTVPHCQQMHKVVFYSQLDLVWRITIAQCDQVWRTNSSVVKCGALTEVLYDQAHPICMLIFHNGLLTSGTHRIDHTLMINEETHTHTVYIH